MVMSPNDRVPRIKFRGIDKYNTEFMGFIYKNYYNTKIYKQIEIYNNFIEIYRNDFNENFSTRCNNITIY